MLQATVMKDNLEWDLRGGVLWGNKEDRRGKYAMTDQMVLYIEWYMGRNAMEF